MNHETQIPQMDTAVTTAAELFSKLPAASQDAILDQMKSILSESERNSALLQDGVSGMPWFYLCVYWYAALANGAVLNVMITFSGAHKNTVILDKNRPDFFLILRHQTASLSRRSEIKAPQLHFVETCVMLALLSFPPQREEVSSFEYNSRNLGFCHGKRNRLFRLQMAGQKQMTATA